jgi:radical SAM protein with 4Fe4S-binding SPASM domain
MSWKEKRMTKEESGFYGSFLKGLEVDDESILEKLGLLISERIALLQSSSEEREILLHIQGAVREGRRSNVIISEDPSDEVLFKFSDQELDWLFRHSEDLWVKYIVYRYKFKIYPVQRKVTDFPLYLLIEPTSICNLRCVMCFQVDRSFRTKEYMGMMPWDLFTSIIDEASKNDCPAICFASRGEPTLHKRFGDMLKYTADAGILDVKINTHAGRLNDELSRDILSSGVSEVVFSVDAATKKTYEEIRVRGHFDKVVENVKRFQEIRKSEYPGSPTITRISGMKVRDDQDAEQMTSFWSQYVDQVVIRGAEPRWDTYNNPKMNEERACRRYWKQVYVWWDGGVNPCDFDYKSKLQLGDINSKTTIKDIWHSEAITKLRQDHLNGKRGDHVPCDRCPLT